MSAESSKERLPFEPPQKKKKTPKKQPSTPTPIAEPKNTKAEASLSAIPENVSKRMITRMALFSGVPTALGVTLFFTSYWVVSQGLLEIPPIAVLLTTMGSFGLGVIGLSYGIFSTSWDEERAGSWLGIEELKLNLGRTFAAWRSTRQEAKKK